MVLTLIQQGLGLRPREKRALCGKMRRTCHYLANMRYRPNITLMLAHRLRRWTNIKPTLGQCDVCSQMLGYLVVLSMTVEVLRTSPLAYHYDHYGDYYQRFSTE